METIITSQTLDDSEGESEVVTNTEGIIIHCARKIYTPLKMKNSKKQND